MCHYIASTKIPKFWKRKKENENMTADEGMEFASKIQSKSEKAKKEFIRRPTIAHLSAYHNKKGKGEHLNLEKIWLDEFKSTGTRT